MFSSLHILELDQAHYLAQDVAARPCIIHIYRESSDVVYQSMQDSSDPIVVERAC